MLSLIYFAPRLTKEKKYKKRSAFLPTVLSITIVLFLCGLLGLISYNASLINSYFRENFEIRLFLSNESDIDQAIGLSLDLKGYKEIKSANFVSKDDAAAIEIKEQGIDFIETFGYNPLPHAIHITLNAAYTNDSIVNKLVSQLKQNPLIDDIGYPENLLTLVNNNLKKIELSLVVILIVFVLASLLVINSTIRLNIFARRFLIKSMQYVGATDSFIIKPFLKMYFWQGIAGALLAIILNAGLVVIVNNQLPGLLPLHNLIPYLIIAIALIIIAIIIILPATYIACKKYLHTDINKLY